MLDKENTWYFIINPTAGNGKAKKRWPSIAQQLEEAGIQYQTAFTTKKGHAITHVEQVIKEGYRKIVGVGGDGTNNEIINGIMYQSIIPPSEITYTLLPVGTGNDWIRTHEIPKNIKAWITMLQAGLSIYQDVGWVKYQSGAERKKRYFANIAGMAYDAYLVKDLEESNSIFPPKLQYILSLVFSLFKYTLRKVHIKFDDQYINDYCYTINAGICKYAGGGMQIVPHADFNDGKLGITIAANASKWYIIRHLNYLYSGKIGKLSRVSTHHTKSIKIEADDSLPTYVEVDGEFLGTTPVEMGIEAGVLKVVVPIF